MQERTDDDYCRHYPYNDSHAVMFSNKTTLTTDAVKILFSKYGAIKEVQQKGTPTGICLVKFEEKSSAIKCIKDVDGRWPIRLRPFNPEHVKNSGAKRRGGMREDDRPKEDGNEGDMWGSSGRTNGVNDKAQRSDDTAGKNERETHVSEASNSTAKECSSAESVASSLSRPEAIIVENENADAVDDENVDDFNGKNCLGLEEVNAKQDVNQIPDDSASLGSKESLEPMKIWKRPTKLFLRRPKIFSDNVFYSVSQGRVLPVVLKKPWQEDPVEHVVAQEVIVGNIDLECDVNFIMSLFHDYQPLLVSSMKLDEKNSFQYCHVYFKTEWQARAVEKRWDDAKVCGRNIIVLRAETLAQLIQ